MELLVTVSIIALLIAILLPAFSAAQNIAFRIKGVVNQRNTVTALNIFANDYNNRYPPSIATMGTSPDEGEKNKWNWADPRLITGYPNCYEPRMSAGGHRSLGAYMNSYIENPEILYCNSSPGEFPYWQQAWEAGDDWDHPGSPQDGDPVSGTYCFYWNYTGYLSETEKAFRGPRSTSSGGRGRSTILLSDYFGANTWRNEEEYGSSQIFKGAGSTESSNYYADFWTGGDAEGSKPDIKLSAAYVDGHAEYYDSDEVVTMEIINRDESEVFDPEVGKGKFFLPEACLPY